MNVIYVTGNPGKAKYFSKLIGMEIRHHCADTDEIQSLDLEEIATDKAKQAFSQLKCPVIVEDTGIFIDSLGDLPGAFTKWFEKAIGLDGVCRLADLSADRSATAKNVHVYYDGKLAKVFKGSLKGTIARQPRGTSGFGFNPVFIPKEKSQTLVEMSEQDFTDQYLKIKPILRLKDFLLSLDIK